MTRHISRREVLAGASAAIAATVAGWNASSSRIASGAQTALAPLSPVDALIGESAAMGNLRDTVRALLERVAGLRHPPPVWIFGETGVGKSLVGRVLHQASGRAAGPLIEACFAAIPQRLLEAEMFALHSGGRPAGSTLFHSAHKGTLQLDEIERLPGALQRKIADAIEAGAQGRLGSLEDERTNLDVLTVIASTPRSHWGPSQRSAASLYRRLAPIELTVPPLRERGDDVLVLANNLLPQYLRDYGRPGKTLSPAAQEALRSYSWPGNVRQLFNVIEVAVLLCDGRRIEPADLVLPEPWCSRT